MTGVGAIDAWNHSLDLMVKKGPKRVMGRINPDSLCENTFDRSLRHMFSIKPPKQFSMIDATITAKKSKISTYQTFENCIMLIRIFVTSNVLKIYCAVLESDTNDKGITLAYRR